MNRDAHYYATLAFCRACGFSKESAHVIAYANQFVDDAKINLIFFEKPESVGEIKHDIVHGKPAFFNMATCHSYFKIETFNYEAMTKNTCAFHFVPGCKGKNFTKKLRCRQESPVIMGILDEALREDDLVKFGVVLHVYVDTFSHQGFSGMLSKVNNIKNCEAKTKVHYSTLEKIQNLLKLITQKNYDKYFDLVMPAYGHGQALNFPDIPYLVWSYEYDTADDFCGHYKRVEVDNKVRYSEAFSKLRGYLEKYLEDHPHYRDTSVNFQNFDLLFAALLYENSEKKREENWRKVMLDQGLFSEDDKEILHYCDCQWLQEAFANFDAKKFHNRVVKDVRLTENFAASHWYKFYQAIKWYKNRFFYHCSLNQLEIPR